MHNISKYTSLIVTGSIAYDDIMNFPGRFVDHFHPEKLHQINISFVVDTLNKHIGGTATNISYNLKRITKKRVIICGGIGRDDRELMNFYKKNSIDTDGLYKDKLLYTSTGKVITDTKDNQIWGYYYGAGARGNLVDFAPFSKNAFGIISANHPDAYYHAQTYFIKNKIPYLYDPGMALTFITNKKLLEGIKHASFLVGNDYEIAQIERRLKIYTSEIVKMGLSVILTLGEKGVRYIDSKEDLIIPGYKVKRVVDPTGAGDAWRGGFIGALVEGQKLRDALSLANALASFAVEERGTVSHKPKLVDIKKRAKNLY